MIDTTKLVRECQKQDARAQRQLYDWYKTKLMGICRRYAASREEAQDVLQESFIKIFNKIGQLDSPEKLEGWMTRITINTAVNYYHRARKNLFEDITMLQAENGDYELLLSKISDEFLMKLINDLPDGCRLVFNMFVVEGYSHEEIGKMLQITESTSRSQLVYAKNLLKEQLQANGVMRYERYA